MEWREKIRCGRRRSVTTNFENKLARFEMRIESSSSSSYELLLSAELQNKTFIFAREKIHPLIVSKKVMVVDLCACGTEICGRVHISAATAAAIVENSRRQLLPP
jgi:hypothetical protein